VTTTNKDFRVKNGLIVEGNSATVNGNQVITSADAANYALKNAANTFSVSPQIINTGADANKGIILRQNSASQTGDLLQVQNSAGTQSSLTIDGNGNISTKSGINGAVSFKAGATGELSSVSIYTYNAARKGLVIKGIASQTANLQEWQNNAGTVIASIGPAGSITTTSNITQSTSGRTFIGGAADYGAFLNVNTPTATRQGLVVRANASQSANIQEWQNSAGTILSGINAAGQIHAGTTTSINGSIFTQITNRSYDGSPTVATFEYSGTSLVQVGQMVTLFNFAYGTEDFNGTWPVTAVTSNSFTVLGSGFPNTIFGTLGKFTVSSTASFVANTAVTTPVVVKGAASQTANLQEWQNSTGSPLLCINSAGQIQAPNQSSSLAVKASPTRTATITAVSTDGTYVTYVATNTFTVGEIVTITGVSPAAYNLSSVVISQVSGNYFSVENAATGTYVSGGTATVVQIADLQQWQDGSGTILANVSSSGGFTVPSLTVSGDLTVNGTTTNINSTNLVVEDKNIIIGDTATPTDITADGGGITLKGTTDKTFNWVDSTDSWTSSEHLNLASGKSLYLNGTLLKDASETLTNKTLTSPKINEDVAVTATATEINVLDGITSTTAELNILDGVTSTAAEINLLDGVTATTTELNYVDGVTSAIQTQIDAKAPSVSPTLTTPALGVATATSIAFADTLIGSATASTSDGSTMTVDTWSATTYSAAKYIVQIRNLSGDIQVVEVLVAVDSSNNVYLTKYANINSQVIDGIAYELATINAIYSGGNVLLQVIPAGSGLSRSVGVSKTYIEKILVPEGIVAEE
jgi:hypothetical protein